jgi:hypothetical protein
MNLKNQPPVLVPYQFSDEIEKCSKAFLMDIAWDYAQRIAGTDDPDSIMREFRATRDVIGIHRFNARKP